MSVISGYVSLKQKGRNFVGLCPFHSEKSGSFTVSPDKRIWHCFGCHESGDLIKFVMQIEHIPFYEAVRVIAEKSGIPVVETTENSHLSKKDILNQQIRDLLYYANQFFRQTLTQTAHAATYFKNRGVSPETIEKFQLGYCPTGKSLYDHIKRKNPEAESLERSGLFFATKTGDLIPKFRERLIFPISDARGVVRGFGGRIIEDRPEIAKYLNSEDSPVFNKRFLLYGFHIARSAIQKNKSALIMEGYMDVIMAHQYGFSSAVGTMGTALTREQVTTLKSIVDTVYLVFDSDAAGQSAIEKSIELLSQEGVASRIIVLPQKDPADTLTAIGAAGFQKLIETALPILLFKFQRAKNRMSQDRIEDVPKVLDEVLPLLRLEKDPIITNHYVQLFARELKISEEFIVGKLKNIRYSARSGPVLKTKKEKKNKYDLAEEALVYFMATDVELRVQILEKINPAQFSSSSHTELATAISAVHQTDLNLVEQISDIDLQKQLQYILVKGEEDRLGDQKSNWIQYAEIVESQHRVKEVDVLKKKIKESEARGDEAEIIRLLGQLNTLKS